MFHFTQNFFSLELNDWEKLRNELRKQTRIPTFIFLKTVRWESSFACNWPISRHYFTFHFVLTDQTDLNSKHHINSLWWLIQRFVNMLLQILHVRGVLNAITNHTNGDSFLLPVIVAASAIYHKVPVMPLSHLMQKTISIALVFASDFCLRSLHHHKCSDGVWSYKPSY